MAAGKPSTLLAAGIGGIFALCLIWCLARSVGPRQDGRRVLRQKAGDLEARQPRNDSALGGLFAGTNVPAFDLEINSAGIQSLRRHPRDWVPGTLHAGSETFRNAAVHIKGSQGSLQSIDARPSLTISFGTFAHSRFHGVRKIHFNNSAEDPSFMTEILCSELCRKAGLPAARSAHATLTLNGRSLGLYVLTEGLTKEFLGQFFAKTHGNLYDGGFRKDVDEPLERIGGRGPDDQLDRLALLAAARQWDPQRRWDKLNQVLDMNRFMSLLAMSTILWNWDGYAMARNNYRIYHDPGSDRLVFFPHGQDQMFWEPQGSIYPRLQGLVAVSVMGIPAARLRYRERLAALHRDVFSVDLVESRIDDLVALITPYRTDAPQQGARLKRLVAARSRSIASQLADSYTVDH
jgi:hypothetical protein